MTFELRIETGCVRHKVVIDLGTLHKQTCMAIDGATATRKSGV